MCEFDGWKRLLILSLPSLRLSLLLSPHRLSLTELPFDLPVPSPGLISWPTPVLRSTGWRRVIPGGEGCGSRGTKDEDNKFDLHDEQNRLLVALLLPRDSNFDLSFLVYESALMHAREPSFRLFVQAGAATVRFICSNLLSDFLPFFGVLSSFLLVHV